MGVMALRFRDFSFAYATSGKATASNEPCIGPLSWDVERGSFTLLVGGTGSGKTTLLRCAKPELAPTGERQGSVEAFGKRVEDMTVEESACTIGYVAQSPDNQLVCTTVWHQMAFGLENLGVDQSAMRRRVAEVAHFFNIGPWFESDVNALSGGQKQLLNLASVLVTQPRLLLLDEPTAQLDPVAEKNFLHALFRLNRELGITVVMVTHAPDAAVEYATHAARLVDGKIEQVDRATLGGEGPIRFEAGASLANRTSPVEGASGPSVPSETKGVVGANGTEGANVAGGTGRPSVPGGSDESMAVCLKEAFFRYGKNESWVLRGSSLEVAHGTIHCLLGGNGCGKTTMLGVVAGSLSLEKGSVANGLRRSQAYVPQNPKALFACDTVGEELREWQRACQYGEPEVSGALRHLGLVGCESQHPYDLSGGQQQLLALGKVLLTRPQLLLLDEPSKGLDREAKLKVAQLLDAFRNQGGTILMSTHDLTFVAALADEVSLVFDGEVTCTEGASSFFRGNLFYRPQSDGFWQAWQGRRNVNRKGVAYREGAC